MSVEAITWAFQQDPGASGTKLLLVALANESGHHGVTFVGQDFLARACSCRRETISRNMAALEEAGLIRRVQRRRPNGSRTSDFTVLAPGWPDRGAMREASAEEVGDTVAAMTRPESSRDESSRDEKGPGHVRKSGGPEPSGNRESLRGSGERAGKPRISGKPVDDEAWSMTVAVLAEFNEQAGRHLAALTGAGEPSDTAKRIYGRVRAFPGLTLAQHADIIRRTLASRWWGDGEASVGVVYGPRVFEENMTRRVSATGTGATSSGSGRLRDMAAELERQGL